MLRVKPGALVPCRTARTELSVAAGSEPLPQPPPPRAFIAAHSNAPMPRYLGALYLQSTSAHRFATDCVLGITNVPTASLPPGPPALQTRNCPLPRLHCWQATAGTSKHYNKAPFEL